MIVFENEKFQFLLCVRVYLLFAANPVSARASLYRLFEFHIVTRNCHVLP